MRNITGMLTPHGLKIRLDGDFCQQLSYKNNNTVNDILNDVERYVCLDSWLIFIVGIFAFLTYQTNNTLFVLAFVITVVIAISNWIHPLFLLTRGTLFLTQPRIFVTLTGWFLDKIILIVIGIFTVGWMGLFYFAGGYTIGTFLGFFINLFLAKSKHSQFGVVLQSDENAFIFLSLRYLERTSYMDWIKSYYDYLNS